MSSLDLKRSTHFQSKVAWKFQLALLRRAQTGQGDYLDVAMMDAILACMPNSMGAVFADGTAPVPKEERIWGGAAFYRIYETADGAYVTLGGSELKFASNALEACSCHR